MSQNWLARYCQSRQQHRLNFTRKVAHQLYENRQVRNKAGDAATDWARAEKIVRRPWNRALFRVGFLWRRRVEAFERSWFEAAMEGLVNDLSNLAIVDLLGVLASLSLITGAVGYFLEAGDRRKQTHYQAWEVINSAVGREAESGRRAAIEDLWADGVSLAGLDIRGAVIPDLDLGYQCYFSVVRLPSSVCKVPASQARPERIRLGRGYRWRCYIPKVQSSEFMCNLLLFRSWRKRADLRNARLDGASLKGVNLEGADFWKANLEEANLKAANLQGTDFSDVNLQKADLQSSNLRESSLEFANLEEANLENVDLERANLRGVNLKGANLELTGLREADLRWANLQNTNLGSYSRLAIGPSYTSSRSFSPIRFISRQKTDLHDANLGETDLHNANLVGLDFEGVNLDGALLSRADLQNSQNLTTAQLANALLCRTQLPADLSIDPNRDCKKVKKWLRRRYSSWSEEQIKQRVSEE